MADGGHSFGKKTFHKPTYCHHCSDLLWGLIGQGYICEVCNFIVHERCVSNVITPCSGIAPCIIKNPVAHCWSEPTHHRKKFCTVCRKRLDETPAVHCLICEYFAHVECQDFAVPDCKENATYVPGKELLNVKHQHHWREGNLPSTSKCAYCKKTCWSSECLTGYRCEWCGMTTHGGCRSYITNECTFGVLQPIYLPPHAVSIPRTEVPMEAIIGVQVKSKSTPLQRDYSCPELRTIGLYNTTTTTTDREIILLTQQDKQNKNLNLNLYAIQQQQSSNILSISSSNNVLIINNDDGFDNLNSIQNCLRIATTTTPNHNQNHNNHNGSSSNQKNKLKQKSWPRLSLTSCTNPSDDNIRPDIIDVIDSKHKLIDKNLIFFNNLWKNNTNETTTTSRKHRIDDESKKSCSNIEMNESPQLMMMSYNDDNDNYEYDNDDKCHMNCTKNSNNSSNNDNSNRGFMKFIKNDVIVSRSKSFQEAGIKLPIVKKSSRFFIKRKNSPSVLSINKSDGYLDTISQNIEIHIHDEDGNENENENEQSRNAHKNTNSNNIIYSPPLHKTIIDHYNSSNNRTTTDSNVLNRLLRRMRKISIGWKKTNKYKNKNENNNRARSISEEFSSGDTARFREEEYGRAESAPTGSSGGGGSSHYRSESAHKSDKDKKDRDKEDRDEESVKVFDGNCSLRRRIFRVITVSRTANLEQLLTTALRAFHINRDPNAFYLTDLYASGNEDIPLQDSNPVGNLTHIEGKRPAIFLRFRDKENDKGFVRVYPGKLQSQVEEPYVSVPVDNDTTVRDLIRDALDRFGLQDNQIQDYRCSEVLLDRGVTERILLWNERPWEIMKQLGKDSIRQMELMRFYLQHKQDPHGPNIALFVGNLPPGLSQRNYEQILSKYATEENKFTSIGPIYYEYGSVVITFEDSSKAVRAFYNLRETIVEDKKLLVLLLPNIEPSMVPSDVRPLLVFVNVKSGGCQGLELISSFRKLLNPYQVFDLDNGGPLPGLYVFRQIKHYKILVCGGDGTIGWVLQCLDNVGQDSECSSPPCAIVPLGTGNDLARVLRWGPGYTGGEDPLNLLRDVIEAEEIRLDRWTVVFHPEDKPEDQALKAPSNSTGGGTQSEDNSQIFVMNNYFGIGIDADLCLDFHNAREENPNKFNSRLHNKSVYVKMGLRKIVGRKTVKELHKELRLEVDGKVVDLPPVEGIIILNILSWGSGANPWGPEKEDQFTKPNHYDGVLEIVGVTGVVHLGQIQSGLRSAMRIAQGGHIKIHLHSDIPVQVDGEPWVQSPGDVVVLKSALKATMLKKNKGKMKRRNTEPTMIVAGTAAASASSTSATTSAAGIHSHHHYHHQLTLTLPPSHQEVDETITSDNLNTNNTDF